MTQLYEIQVSLSPNQKKNLSNAYHKRETIVLRLAKDSLSGNDTLYVPQNIVKRLEKNRKLKKGMDIKLSKTNIRKQTTKQKKDILNALQTGSGVHIKPTKVQTGGFLGTLLASIGVPLAIEAIKKMTGKGAPQMGQPKQRPSRSIPKPTNDDNDNQDGGFLIPTYRTPPFYGNWPDQTFGMGTKKKAPKKKAQKKGKGLLLGKNSPFKNVPLLNILL